MILRFIYTIFIGVLFATMVGVGISAFYKGPVYPDTPATLRYPQSENLNSVEREKYIAEQEAFDRRSEEFQKQSNTYERNVSIIAVVAALATVVVSLFAAKTLLIIADGLLLGGVLTLLYGIVRGFGAGDDIYRFIIVTIGFIVSIILGYLKLIQSSKPVKSKK